MSTATLTAEAAATARVNSAPELAPYADLILRYDWSNRDEHLEWVATAPVADIVDWAEGIRRDEDAS